MKKIIILGAVLSLMAAGSVLYASDSDWRENFDRICAFTVDAGQLDKVELEKLISESDELLKIIESSNSPEKKLFLIRLKKCRNFFMFMRDVEQNKGAN